MNVLLVGGYGYIGYHIVRYLKKFGHNVIILDNRANLKIFNNLFNEKFKTYDVSFSNITNVQKILKINRIELIIQTAGHSLVQESVVHPSKYFINNASGNVLLLEAAAIEGVKKFIYISSAAVYGNSPKMPVDEYDCKNPISPLGSSQLFVENALEGFRVSNEISYAVLRAPNLIGLHFNDCDFFKENNGSDLIANLFNCALGRRVNFEIYGKNFKTSDKTAEREFLYIDDFCDAVMKSFQGLDRRHSKQIYNIGTGRVHSVCDMIDICEIVCNVKLNIVEKSQRAGDTAQCVFDTTIANNELNWHPLNDSVEKIIADMWHLLKK